MQLLFWVLFMLLGQWTSMGRFPVLQRKNQLLMDRSSVYSSTFQPGSTCLSEAWISSKLLIGSDLILSILTCSYTQNHRVLARTARSFCCTTLLASLARSTALLFSLASSLYNSWAHGKDFFVYEMNASIGYHFHPLFPVTDLVTHSSGHLLAQVTL